MTLTIKILWAQMCVTCRSCARARCLGPEGWRHTYEMDREHFANPSLSVVVGKYWFLGFVV